MYKKILWSNNTKKSNYKHAMKIISTDKIMRLKYR